MKASVGDGRLHNNMPPLLFIYQLPPITSGGEASLSVRACDCGFRNEPQNKTDYCGDTNLGILTILGNDQQMVSATAIER